MPLLEVFERCENDFDAADLNEANVESVLFDAVDFADLFDSIDFERFFLSPLFGYGGIIIVGISGEYSRSFDFPRAKTFP
jgi:hypothetical protein